MTDDDVTNQVREAFVRRGYRVGDFALIDRRNATELDGILESTVPFSILASCGDLEALTGLEVARMTQAVQCCRCGRYVGPGDYGKLQIAAAGIHAADECEDGWANLTESLDDACEGSGLLGSRQNFSYDRPGRPHLTGSCGIERGNGSEIVSGKQLTDRSIVPAMSPPEQSLVTMPGKASS